MSAYKKFKERTPEETVFEVQRLLHEAGLFTVMHDTSGDVRGLCSNRVQLCPSRSMGQNGKGTDERYAAASGYAELMERLQNGWLYQKLLDPELMAEGGFREFPDEVKMPISDFVAQDNPYMEDIYTRLGLETSWAREGVLESLAREYYGLTDGTLNVLPYVDIFGGQIVYLPFALVTLFGVSNGMSAGNTLEEAMVQGLSELYERYVHLRLLRENLTPPEIPREELEASGLKDLIEKLEESGRYTVSVRDCSLGEDYPVSCVIITDREKGTFSLKPGAHPSFAISVERTLTESFQGKNLSACVSSSRVGTRAQVEEYHNAMNIAKIGNGFYPASLFGSRPDWQYRPWKQWESSSNREHLQKLLAHAKAHGYRPLVRDNSHLGFPSLHLVIPGIHDIYEVSMTRIRDLMFQLKAARALNHFPSLTAEEEESLFKYLRFKSSAVENEMGLTLLHDFLGDGMSAARLGAFLGLKRKDFERALKFFGRLVAISQGAQRRYYECYSTLVLHLGEGLPLQEAQHLISSLYDRETAERVCRETEDLAGLPGRVFPQLRCFDCGNCELSGQGCEYLAVRELRRKIKAAIGRSKVSQEALAEELKHLI